ncbi:FimV/HubP family polar landmark protein [Rhodoferax sp. WC2427]|uniref:FimV/HubP family polar landmark protein n=1 Tax=Rhodoferax sp. WC2427 TaxID=3234144 RepID=UPI003466DC66
MASAVVATLVALASGPAMALSLGRMTVLSGLGEPLRADIELPDITADEASSLKPEVAPAEAFRAAGLEYNPALADLRIVLQRRADGKSILRLSSTRTVTDPFIDLILQVNWSSGRIVRDYTILLDPPSTRQAPAAAATAPQITAPAAVAPAAAPPAPAAAPAATPAATPAAASPARAAPPKPSMASAPKPASSDAKQVTVKAGDTASKIAGATRPTNVSLDQMLVAMLRANPNAFINGNVNRVKAGAVLNLPDASQASSTPPVEATQIITAQSRDFNAFRSKLAGGAPSVQVAEADRKASGKVQAQVDEKKPSTAAPDKLTLSKGALKSKTDEDKIARDKADQEASARVAELAKNITELNKLGASTTVPSAPVASAAKAPVAELPAIPVAVPAPPVASAPVEPTPAVSAPVVAAAVAPVASAPASEPAAPVAAPASAPASAASAVAPAPAAEESDSWMDTLRNNPLVLAAAGLVALLGGFGVYSARKRKQMASADSSFLESRLQADSFFGASGGQRVDTHADEAPASSMSYSPSQLDAASDVDPVAEADVYLAYGRDLQAEEILKEALRATPDRMAIHSKLLEIYAKRRDIANFAGLATIAHALTDGQGPEWERIAAMGHGLDPNNSLYHSAQAHAAATAADSPTWMNSIRTEPAADAPISGFAPVAAMDPPAGLEGLDLDLDLDFLDSDLPATTDAPAAPLVSDPLAASLTLPAALDLPHAAEDEPFDGLDFDLDLSTASSPLSGPTAAAPAAEDAPGAIGFDLSSLSLDLDEPAPELPSETADTPEAEAETDPIDESDPLATKLSLAEEFSSIGDEDGARALAEEVLEEATGALRAKAQKFLDSLS